MRKGYQVIRGELSWDHGPLSRWEKMRCAHCNATYWGRNDLGEAMGAPPALSIHMAVCRERRRLRQDYAARNKSPSYF